MDWIVFNFLSSAISLIAISSALMLATAFLKLNLLVQAPASRLGLGASLTSLGVWLIYGMLWCVSMLPYGITEWIYQLYEIRPLFRGLGLLATLSMATSLLCLAWTLHRGIHPAQTTP